MHAGTLYGSWLLFWIQMEGVRTNMSLLDRGISQDKTTELMCIPCKNECILDFTGVRIFEIQHANSFGKPCYALTTASDRIGYYSIHIHCTYSIADASHMPTTNRANWAELHTSVIALIGKLTFDHSPVPVLHLDDHFRKYIFFEENRRKQKWRLIQDTPTRPPPPPPCVQLIG